MIESWITMTAYTINSIAILRLFRKKAAIAIVLLLVAAAVAVISVKVALFVVAGSVVVFGAYKLYNNLFGSEKSLKDRGYGPVPLEPKK